MDKVDQVLMCRLRGAEWGGISNKLRGMTMCNQDDIREWLLEIAGQAESRSEEAYAIAKEIDKDE